MMSTMCLRTYIYAVNDLAHLYLCSQRHFCTQRVNIPQWYNKQLGQISVTEKLPSHQKFM